MHISAAAQLHCSRVSVGNRVVEPALAGRDFGAGMQQIRQPFSQGWRLCDRHGFIDSGAGFCGSAQRAKLARHVVEGRGTYSGERLARRHAEGALEHRQRCFMQLEVRVDRPKALQQLGLLVWQLLLFGDSDGFAHGANGEMKILQEQVNIAADREQRNLVANLVLTRRQIESPSGKLQALEPAPSSLTPRGTETQHIERFIGRQVAMKAGQQGLAALKGGNVEDLRHGPELGELGLDVATGR